MAKVVRTPDEVQWTYIGVAPIQELGKTDGGGWPPNKVNTANFQGFLPVFTTDKPLWENPEFKTNSSGEKYISDDMYFENISSELYSKFLNYAHPFPFIKGSGIKQYVNAKNSGSEYDFSTKILRQIMFQTHWLDYENHPYAGAIPMVCPSPEDNFFHTQFGSAWIVDELLPFRVFLYLNNHVNIKNPQIPIKTAVQVVFTGGYNNRIFFRINALYPYTDEPIISTIFPITSSNADILTDRLFPALEYQKRSPVIINTGKPAGGKVIVVTDGSNVYDKGGETESTPTEPKYDDSGNKVGDTPVLPGSNQPGFGQLGNGEAGTENSNIDSTAAGLFRSYAMTLSQVNNFGSKLWSKGILDSLVKFFDDPLKVVLGLIEYPFPITAHGADKEITFSWIPEWANPLNVTGAPLNGEYVTISFGSLQIPRYSGTFYDFQPYTTAQVYIPYVGFVPVKYSEIVGSTLTLEYTVSLTSGVAIANLVSGKIGVIGSYNCTVGRMLPLSSNNFGALYMAVIKAAVIGIATAGLGLAAGAALGTASTMAGMSEASLGNAVTLESMGATSTANLVLDQAINQEALAMQAGTRGAQLGSMAKRGRQAFGASAINAVANANAPIQRSGSLDAISGRCAKQKAFVLISIPHQNAPALYNGLIGYPSNIGGTLGQFSGYFEARSIQIQAEGATAVEISELEDILRGGIYIG